MRFDLLSPHQHRPMWCPPLCRSIEWCGQASSHRSFSCCRRLKSATFSGSSRPKIRRFFETAGFSESRTRPENPAILWDRGIFGVKLSKNPAMFWCCGIFGVSLSEDPVIIETAGFSESCRPKIPRLPLRVCNLSSCKKILIHDDAATRPHDHTTT